MARAVAAAMVLWITTSTSLADELTAYLLRGDSTPCALLSAGIIAGEGWLVFA